MRDACGMVGAPHHTLVTTLASAGIPQERVGRAKGVNREAFRRLTSDIVFMGEIVAAAGRKPVAQSYELRRVNARKAFGA